MKKIIKVMKGIIYIPLAFGVVSVFAVFVFVFFYGKHTELDKMTKEEITDYFYKNKKI